MNWPSKGEVMYTQLKDGDTFELNPKGEKIKFACCDCGLVHDIAFAVEENGNIGVALQRNIDATEKRRKEIAYSNGWIDAKTELPKEEGRFLCRRRNGIISIENFYIKHPENWLKFICVSHWMKVPQLTQGI